MRNYSVPESIRKMKPVGTMVKNISGYVYEYKTVADENGNRKTATGNNIGSIKPDKGFIPNDNYDTFSKSVAIRLRRTTIIS